MSGWTFVVMGVIGAAALISVVLAWRMAREERQRSEARVAALAAAIDPSRPGEGLFAREPARPTPLLRTAVTGFVVVVVALALMAATLTLVQNTAAAGPAAARTVGSAPLPQAARPVTPEAPLELLSTTYTRSGDRLLVGGVVRNRQQAPLSGDAEVIVLDDHGRVLGSARAPLGNTALASGATSSFRLALKDLAGVRRYRVSFSGPAGIIHHVDRRTRSDAR